MWTKSCVNLTLTCVFQSLSDAESFWRNQVGSGRPYEQNQTESKGPQTSKSVHSRRLPVCTGEKACSIWFQLGQTLLYVPESSQEVQHDPIWAQIWRETWGWRGDLFERMHQKACWLHWQKVLFRCRSCWSARRPRDRAGVLGGGEEAVAGSSGRKGGCKNNQWSSLISNPLELTRVHFYVIFLLYYLGKVPRCNWCLNSSRKRSVF